MASCPRSAVYFRCRPRCRTRATRGGNVESAPRLGARLALDQGLLFVGAWGCGPIRSVFNATRPFGHGVVALTLSGLCYFCWRGIERARVRSTPPLDPSAESLEQRSPSRRQVYEHFSFRGQGLFESCVKYACHTQLCALRPWSGDGRQDEASVLCGRGGMLCARAPERGAENLHFGLCYRLTIMGVEHSPRPT